MGTSVRIFGREASLSRLDKSKFRYPAKMVGGGGVLTRQKSSRPSLAEELVLALSKPRSTKEPRVNISKNSTRTNNDDWINFLKKRKDNTSELEAPDNITKLEQTLKEEREKARNAVETLGKEQQAHRETKAKSGYNIGQNDDIRNLLNQEKLKSKGLLDELNSLKKKTENLEGKNGEKIKDLQRENTRTVLELNKLKAWKEEALTRIAASTRLCENQHTNQIEKLREENENNMKAKKMLKELSVSLKKKEFEIELLKGDLEKKNQIIGNMRTELNEMYVSKNINEGNDKNMTSIENVREAPNRAIRSPNTSIVKKRKLDSMEYSASIKKLRADDGGNRKPKSDDQNGDAVKEIKQEMVVLEEQIVHEKDTHRALVGDVLDEIFENIDYGEKKQDSVGDDSWFIKRLLVNMIDDL